MNLQKYQNHPESFQNDLWIPTGRGPRKLGDCMKPFQRERFQAINPSLLAVARQECPPIPRVWDERTKGASKDTDAAVNILWLLGFSRRPLRIQIGAYDGQQADEIRQIVKAILKIEKPVNLFLRQVIDVQTMKICNQKTESMVEILTTDKLGSHGARPDVVILDELTHQKDKGFAETLLDNLDKMPCGLGIIATNSGFDPSWQLQWKKTFADSPRWLILEYNEPAPWVSPEALKESQRRNSIGRFNRLWRGIWGSDTEGAIDSVDIDSCVTQAGPMGGREKGWVYAAGLDIGIRKHSTALVLIGKHVGYEEEIKAPRKPLSSTQRALIDLGLLDEPEEETESIYHEPTHRLRLAYAKCWKPRPGKRVSLEAVKAEIIRVYKRFQFGSLSIDPSQAEHLIELLERDCIPVERYLQSTASLQDQAVGLIESFQERTIDLYNHLDLIADLRALQIKDNGLRIRLVSPEKSDDDTSGTGHGDLASSLAFAITSSKERGFTSRTVVGKIIVD